MMTFELLAFILLSLIAKSIETEWVEVSASSNFNFIASAWPLSTLAIAAGSSNSNPSVLLKSINGGQSWSSIGTNFDYINGLASNTLADTNTYFFAVTSTGTIYSSVGPATSWTSTSVASLPDLKGVTIGSNGNSYACGNGYSIFQFSLPSGSSWSDVSPTTDNSGIFQDISTYNGVGVIAVGDAGNVYYSSNSGSSWSSTIENSADTIYCIDHATASFAVAAGVNGYVSKTTDGGATWSSIAISGYSGTIRYHSISTLSTSNYFVAASNGKIYSTTNGGSSWVEVVTTANAFYSLTMFSSSRGIAGSLSNIFTLVDSKYSMVILFGVLLNH